MERERCVICDKDIFVDAFNIYNTINIVSDVEFIKDELKKLNFMSCVNCGCVQLKNLFLQSEIYSQPLQIFDGPIIRKHHDMFCDFIIAATNYEEELFEIGGAYGNLAKRIIKKYEMEHKNIKYNILEYSSESYPEIDKVNYISGDCELYTYNNIDTIIMSHVFEHLYRPREFIKKISDTNIQNVFISIPDMDNLTINGDINNLNILHTFYVNTQYIVYLFGTYGFDIKKIVNCDNHSNFYHFKKETVMNLISCGNLELPIKQKLFYEKNIETIKNINIDKPFYICPSGFYGQFIYFHLNDETRKNLIGFLDGDKFKIGKRLSGTRLSIYKKEEIKNRDNVCILISSSKHTNEIKCELLSYNTDIAFYCL
jgi:hypothetical protein